MECTLYKVTTGSVDVARYMPLDTALILVKALMLEYYNEPELDYTIKRERRTEETNEKLNKETGGGYAVVGDNLGVIRCDASTDDGR